MAGEIKHLYKIGTSGVCLVVADNEQEAKQKYKTDKVRGFNVPVTCVELASFEVDDTALPDEEYISAFLNHTPDESVEIPDFSDSYEEGYKTTEERIIKAVKAMNERERRDILQMIEKFRRVWNK